MIKEKKSLSVAVRILGMEFRSVGIQDSTVWSLILLLYLGIGVCLLPLFRYQVEPDGISYFSVAFKYLHGDFKNAVNGHWSPMFSWVLVPFLYAGLDAMISAKLANLLIGGVCFVAVVFFVSRFRLCRATRVALYLAFVPILLYCAYFHVSADLLVTCFLFLYFAVVFKPSYGESLKDGLVCGILGGCAYLAKSYGFTYFCAHFFIMNVAHCFVNIEAARRRSIIYSCIVGFSVFLMITVPWVTALSYKYGALTMSTQPANNMQFIGTTPKFPSFIEPPNETAVSIWEDPFYTLPLGTWSPFESLGAFKKWIVFFAKNIPYAFTICTLFSPLACILFLTYCCSLVYKPQKALAHLEMLFLLISTAIYTAGYCLVLVDERYLWPAIFLIIIGGGFVFDRYIKSLPGFSLRRILCMSIFIVSCSIMPLKKLSDNTNTGYEIYVLARQVSAVVPAGSRIASDGNWWESIFLSYHLSSKMIGTTEGLSEAEARAEIERYKIEYFFAWHENMPNQMDFSTFVYMKSFPWQGKHLAVFKTGRRF